jgi:uncharacterized protein involved in exopolysaccharide biosynthesis
MDLFETTTSSSSVAPAFLADPIGVLGRRWRWMLLGLIVGLAATVAGALLMPRRYSAEATIVVSRQQVSEQIVPPTIQEDALSRIDALAAEVLSRKNVVALIEEFDLYPDMRESYAMTEIVDRVRRDVEIRSQKTVGADRGRAATAQVYGLRFQADRPEAAAAAANSLADLFINASIERRSRQHQLTADFLRRERDHAESLLREANREIAAFKGRNRGLLPTDLEPNLARLELLQNQRQSLALQVAEAEARIVTLAADADSSPDAQLMRRREVLREKLASLTDRHPDVIALRSEIGEIEAALEESDSGDAPATPSGLRRAAEVQLAALRAQIDRNEEELARLDESLARMPTVQEDLAALEERAAVLRENYIEFMRKLQDAELSSELLSAQQGERISVLNQAEPPAHPDTSRALVVGAGLAGTLVLSIGIAVLLEFLDPVLLSGTELARLSSAPHLGSVGHILP